MLLSYTQGAMGPKPISSKPIGQTISKYQLGECLGKGAVSSVYRALNWETGEAVAVKQIKLCSIPKSELIFIMTEIELLKNLNHPNIVKYKDYVKSKEHLNIILEKFGKFPENLVAVYIKQVLEGLRYLHDQGVIHRDIKGANILATKEGRVKLADFGVATTKSDSNVVGSPYWMAPEIIELSGATTSSDIWSVGCVVVELLEGKPPYHHLDPMPALFRIVQDEHPPLPETASPVVKDFLMQCFQKDSNLRVSARKLLKHPWIVSIKKRKGDTLQQPKLSPEYAEYAEAVKSVQEWNEALKGTKFKPSSPSHRRRRSESLRLTATMPTKLSKHQFHQNSPFGSGNSPPIPALPSKIPDFTPQVENSELVNLMPFNNSSDLITPPPTSSSQQPSRLSVTIEPEDEGDNWDDDFVDSIPFAKIAGIQSKQLNHKSSDEDNVQTIRLSRFKNGRDKSKKLTVYRDDKDIKQHEKNPLDYKEDNFQKKASQNNNHKQERVLRENKRQEVARDNKELENEKIERNVDDIIEDNSEEKHNSWESMQDTIHIKSKNLNKSNNVEYTRTSLAKPPIVSSITKSIEISKTNKSKPENPAIKSIIKHHTRAHSANSIPSPINSSHNGTNDRPVSPIEVSQKQRNFNGIVLLSSEGNQEDAQNSNEIQQYYESDDDDYNKAFGEDEEDGFNNTLKLNTQLSSNSWFGDDISDEDDPFAEMEENFDEIDINAHIARDKYARACSRLEELINALQPNESEDRLVISCVQIIDLLTEHKELKNHFIIFHGVIPIIELLEICSYASVLSRLLKIVNIIIASNINLQENLCLVGGIPVIMNFTSKRYPYEIRVEAAIFIRQICHTSPVILQMFISCRGLKVLVEFLQEDYNEHKELIWIAVNGIYGVFELQSPTPKNDFCRLLAKNGLLDPLAIMLHHVILDKDPAASVYVDRIVNIFLMFSQGDAYVKEVMATRTRIVSRIFDNLDKLPPNLAVMMLKCIKNISMNSNTLEALQKAKAIQVLTAILDKQEPPYVTEISNQVLNTMFNLCRINKSRQEEAAKAGIIPHLQYFASNKTPLKQFALPILCDMAHTGQVCRDLLWKHNILQLYLDLLVDPFYQVNALEAILAWIQEETSKVESVLLLPKNIELILEAFIMAKANSFENILEPLYIVTQLSTSVACALAQPRFFKRLLHRLGHPKPVVRLNLLRILRSVCDVHPQREAIVERYGLFDITSRMSREDPAVLIRELAREILSQGYFSTSIIKRKSSNEITNKKEQPIIEENDASFSEEDNNARDDISLQEGIRSRRRALSSPPSSYTPSTLRSTTQRPLSSSSLSPSILSYQQGIKSSASSQSIKTPPSSVTSLSSSQRKHRMSWSSQIPVQYSTNVEDSTTETSTNIHNESESRPQQISSTSNASTASLDSSLPFPYQHIRKRDSSRKIRALSHNRSYNSQNINSNEIVEHFQNRDSHSTINLSSIGMNRSVSVSAAGSVNGSVNSSLSKSSHPGGVLGWLKRRVSKDGSSMGKSGKTKSIKKANSKSKLQESIVIISDEKGEEK
ncbi:1497_t:CDS:2 [Scutellospora calospora]|uniref:1497_t:CDS:1 n=1 Tax=Scutellospora calospora TaxID=85575 RepID=A0ACA9KEG4_9GLOM|nr:1497_t:CDS:2 [Scutellospora calospora]